MLFKNLLIGATALFSAVVRADDCSSGPWTDVNSVGASSTGGAFCATKYTSGIVITGVEVWGNSKGVSGIEFYYSDGSNSGLFGKQDTDSHKRLDWDPAKAQISQLKLWGNGNGKQLGHVYIRTTTGDELDVGKDTDGITTYETTVHTGIMLGAFGASGDDIDRVGFLFLRSTISSMTISDIKFDDTPEALNSKMTGLQSKSLASGTYSYADGNLTFTFADKLTKTVTKSYTQSATNTFGISDSIEVSGELLGMGAKETTQLSYSYANTKSEESSTSNTIDLTYTSSGTLKQGETVYCQATAWNGQYTGTYHSTVHIKLADGTDYSFSEQGTMNQIDWSQAESKCQNSPFTKRELKFIA